MYTSIQKVASRFFYVRYFYYISTVIKQRLIMKVTIDLKMFALATIAGIAAFTTATGQIDNYIHFASEDNAMAFFGLCGVTALVSFCGMFGKPATK